MMDNIVNFKLNIVGEVLVKLILSIETKWTQENTTIALMAKKHAFYSVEWNWIQILTNSCYFYSYVILTAYLLTFSDELQTID